MSKYYELPRYKNKSLKFFIKIKVFRKLVYVTHHNKLITVEIVYISSITKYFTSNIVPFLYILLI